MQRAFLARFEGAVGQTGRINGVTASMIIGGCYTAVIRDANRNSVWMLATDAPITLNTTALVFESILTKNGYPVASERDLATEALIRESEDNLIRDAIENAIATRAAFRTRPNVTTNITAEYGDIIFGNATSAPIGVTGPSTVGDTPINLQKTDSSANAVTFTPIAGQTVMGAPSLSLTEQDESVTLALNVTDWRVI
jgi:hypothetical protein